MTTGQRKTNTLLMGINEITFVCVPTSYPDSYPHPSLHHHSSPGWGVATFCNYHYSCNSKYNYEQVLLLATVHSKNITLLLQFCSQEQSLWEYCWSWSRILNWHSKTTFWAARQPMWLYTDYMANIWDERCLWEKDVYGNNGQKVHCKQWRWLCPG
jgi:hypothetical protein